MILMDTLPYIPSKSVLVELLKKQTVKTTTTTMKKKNKKKEKKKTQIYLFFKYSYIPFFNIV